ncbi:delta(7)-sterol 5(6)-desaturase erg32 [Dendroctonus ponderosae]|uniref:Fatty acid hydroxylase domain-containing protein n=2 Tax=Dendroctonus ponderosae TaxID=77166 RepID=J3JUC1_DENPD|nr:delta(7)-sterol 5(6)-desaturase erg32 [Dendroctonus ponderosae]AEE61796.1 unknown [Dendroctonus ponderosae]
MTKKRDTIRIQNESFYDPMAVTWTEKYDKEISAVWNHVPERIAKFLATVAVFVLGVSINGDWIAVCVHLARQFGFYQNIHASSNSSISWTGLSLESLKLNNLWSFWWPSCVISYGMYFIIGGFIQWYYYVRQRETPEEWKCQPQKWLTPELEKNEIFWGSTTLFMNATISSILSCYIYNGGYSSVYYNFSEFGWLWFFLQFPIIFLYQDYSTYWLHRIYHWPFLYKNFHKLHHRYKQPTAFSVTAIHPVESLHIQLFLSAPLFLIPCHWLPFYCVTFYAYYHGIIDHSGVSFKSYWWQPWQPDAIFHDNHHQYFHVNFAFNISYWDKLHGTYRRKDRIYNEELFYGTGKSVDTASSNELKTDLEERMLENPLAYRAEMPYKLTKKEIKRLKKSN